MAKTPTSKPALIGTLPPTPVIAHAVKLAHPEELPAILTTMAHDGWHLLHIVACRHSNEHAAYFRRTTS